MIKRWSTKRKVKQVERIIMSLGYDRFDDIDIDGGKRFADRVHTFTSSPWS